jgi:hypothetical protein
MIFCVDELQFLEGCFSRWDFDHPVGTACALKCLIDPPNPARILRVIVLSVNVAVKSVQGKCR